MVLNENKAFVSVVLTVVFFTSSVKNYLESDLNTVNLNSNEASKKEIKTPESKPNKFDFHHFKEAVGQKESGGNYTVVNKFGYMGKYQFGKGTLERLHIYDAETFLNDPQMQEEAFVAYCKVNKWILRKDIRRSVGKTINGILITESGILAAAHLAGPGNVKKYLRSAGAHKFEDGFGTTIEDYLKKFKGYDTSSIEKERLAVVS